MYSTLQFIVSQLQDRGFSNQQLLRNTDIDEQVFSDPWPYLNCQQYCLLVDNIFQLTNDPAIGLKLSSAFKARHMGIPGYAAISSHTFADARRVLMQYRVLKDPFIYLKHSFSHNNSRWAISFAGVYPADEYVTRFSMEGHILRTARFCEDLTNHNQALKQINLSYPAPNYADLYKQYLPCPVVFNQGANSIEFNPEVLEQTLPAADDDLFKLCTHECDKRLMALDENSAFTNTVYLEIYRAHSPHCNKLLTLYDVANRLYISPRTLRRKLQHEGSSFQHICNNVRRDLSIHYLSTALSTKEVAYLMAYTSVSNFHRAFKQWTGKPISEFSR